MRLPHAAPRATGSFLRRSAGALSLSSLCLLAAPALADDGGAPADGEEGRITLSDRRPAEADVKADAKADIKADAAVRPAGLVSTGCLAEPGCVAPCAPVCDGPVCDGNVCDGAVCDGGCGDGSCGAAGCPLARRLGLGRGYGRGWNGFGMNHGYGTSGYGACPPGGCPPGFAGPGFAGPGVPVPGLCLPGGLPIPGLGLVRGLIPPGIPHWAGRCGGPEECYLCSLAGTRTPLVGKYDHVYAVNPQYRDRRTGEVWAASGTGVPTAVPTAPNVRYTMGVRVGDAQQPAGPAVPGRRAGVPVRPAGGRRGGTAPHPPDPSPEPADHPGVRPRPAAQPHRDRVPPADLHDRPVAAGRPAAGDI